ncbi:hypothetical protein BH10CHL1_BH10CHL1_47000 [soil metagenome]
MTMNKILIPIDGSLFSLQILRYIKRFLAPTSNELILLSVREEPQTVTIEQPGSEDLTSYGNEAEYAIQGNFADEMLPYRRELEKVGFTVCTHVRFGEPIAEIEQCIEEEKIDLVAMTTHGRTGLNRMIMGSVAQHILHHASLPIMLYRTFGEEGATA